MEDSGLSDIWRGDWRGDVTVTNAKNESETVVMALHIAPLGEGAYTWRIEYISDKQHSIREYEIAPNPEAGAGRLIVDEKNGILLDCRLFGTTLLSQFQVQDTLLMSRFEHQGSAIAI